MSELPPISSCPAAAKADDLLRFPTATSLVLALLLGVFGWIGFSNLARSAEPPSDRKEVDAEGQKVKKPKIPPFKCSAWCAFRDYRSYYETEEVRLKQKPDLESLQSRPGSGAWGGYGRRGQWVSLVVEVQNTTEPKDEIVYQGTISIRLDPTKDSTGSGDKPYTTTYAQSFECAPATKKKIRFSVLCPEYDFDPIEVHIAAGGREEVRLINLRDLDAHNKDLIVVVSEIAGAYKYLIPNRQRGEDNPMIEEEKRGREVAVVHPGELPDRWHDLTLADLIIIDGPPRSGFDDAQIDALESYCLNGGQVLISPGADPSRLKPKEGNTRSLADLAGVKCFELKKVRSLDELEPSYRPESPDWELPIIDIRPNRELDATFYERRNKEADRLIERVDRNLGMGSVTMLSFSLRDEKLYGWPGREQLPLNLLAQGRRRPLFKFQKLEPTPELDFFGNAKPSEPPQNSLPGLRNKLDASFANDTPVEIPRNTLVASFLLLYLLAAVPINYFLFGWFKRREVAWLAVPIWAILFSVIAYYVGYSGKVGKLTINEVSVMEAGARQATATARTFLCVYAPRFDQYSLQFKGSDDFEVSAAPEHLVSEELVKTRGILSSDLPKLHIIDGAEGLAVQGLSIQTRATRRLEMIHRVSLQKGIDVKLTENNEKEVLAAHITNGTSFKLINMTLLHPKPDGELAGLRLGELDKGDVFKRDILATEWQNRDKKLMLEFVETALGKARGQDALNRKRALLDYIWERFPHYQRSLLIAWIDGGVLPVQVDQEIPAREDGLTLLIMPIRIESSARKVDSSLDLPLHFSFDADVLDALESNAMEEQITWKRLPVGKDFAPFGYRSADQALVFVKFKFPGAVRSLVDGKIQVGFSLAALTAKQFGAKNRVPSRYRGKLSVEVRQFTGSRYRWVEIPLQETSVDLAPGSDKVMSVRFSSDLTSAIMDDQNAVWFKVQVSALNVTGSMDNELTVWPLAIKDLQPTRLSGRNMQR